MATGSCFISNILQNTLICAQQNKETNTGLKQGSKGE